MLIHGGYWRSFYTKALMNGLARAVVQQGWAAWNIEYRRIGPLGGGGGWPASFADVRAAIDHVSRLRGVDPDRLITCGHSAAGTFALWAGHSGLRPDGPGDDPPKVRPRAAVALAGVTDLERAAALGLGNDVVPRFLGGLPHERPDAYRSGSPAALLPLGIPQVLLHGLSDSVVPQSMSSDYQKAASRAGEAAVYVPIDGLGHRELIDPSSDAWQAISASLERLLQV